jgi:hypothetical protein
MIRTYRHTWTIDECRVSWVNKDERLDHVKAITASLGTEGCYIPQLIQHLPAPILALDTLDEVATGPHCIGHLSSAVVRVNLLKSLG